MFSKKNTLWKKSAQIFCGLFIAFTLVIAPLGQQTARATGWPTVDALTSGNVIAGNVSNGVTTAKTVLQWVAKLLQELLKAIAKVLLNKLTEATVNWINGGFSGSPKFVENPKSFFKNIGDTSLENLIDTVGYNASKFPYGRQISQALIGGYKSKNGDIGSRLKYTLTDIVGSEAQHFESSFRVGGWAGYNAYNQNPANNPFGALFVGVDQAAKVVQTAQTTVNNELNLGSGFLNQRKCQEWREGPPGGDVVEHTDANCVSWKTTSPGSAVKNQIDKAWGSKFASTELGAALGNGISSIINALTTQLLNKGISALSTAITSDESGNTQQAWSYNGETLSAGNTNDTNDPANWSAADQQNNLNELFYTGVDIGIADDNGNSQKLTLLQQAQLESDAYKKVLDLMHGVRQLNSPLFCQAHPTDQSCSVSTQKSFAEAIMDLDYSLPGPKYHWQQRLTDKFSNGIQKWSQRASSRKNEKRQEKAQNILEWLQDSLDGITTDIGLQLLIADVPSYDEAQSLIKTGVAYNSKEREYSDNYAKTLASIARLKNIKQQLDSVIRCQTDLNQATITEIDGDLAQFVSEHPAGSTIDQAHLNNYPGPAGSCTADWPARLAQPPLVNPLNYLTPAGQQSLKPILKAYSLIYQDLPNSGTISSAQNDAEHVRAIYLQLGLMKAKVVTEINSLSADNIYLVTYGGRRVSFIQDTGEPTVVRKVEIDLANNRFTINSVPVDLNGHSFTSVLHDLMGDYDSALPNVPGFLPPLPPLPGNALLGGAGYSVLDRTFSYQPPGPVPPVPIPPPGKVTRMLISALGDASITGQNSGAPEISGWNQITPSSLSRAEILTNLGTTPWQDNNNHLDANHISILNGLNDQELAVLYSLTVATVPIELDTEQGAWDPNSTGLTRLIMALDLINTAELGFDSVEDIDTTEDTPGRIFFCQAIMDKHDNQDRAYSDLYISLFKREKINCNKIYNSRKSDYRTNS